MQKIKVLTPEGEEMRYVLDPSTLIGLSELNVFSRGGSYRKDASKIWLFLHRHLLKYPGFSFEELIESQKAFLHRLASDYTDFWNDLKLDFEEITPSVLRALAHHWSLRSLHIIDYRGEPLPLGFSFPLQDIESFTMEGECNLDKTKSQFDLTAINFVYNDLEYLKLENVGLTKITPEIVELKKLKVLNLDDNPLKSLPDFLFQIPSRPLLLLRGTQVPEAELEARAKEYPHMQISY